MTLLSKIRYTILFYWYRLRYPLKTIYETPSQEFTIQVTQEGAKRRLIFIDGQYTTIQSEYDTLAPLFLTKEYSQLMMAGFLMRPHPKRILVTGLGGGSIPRVLAHHFPESVIDVVENNRQVIEIAQRFFDLKPSDNLRIIRADASDPEIISENYDIILLDCAIGPNLPEGMKSKNYYQQLHLAEEGIVVANFHRMDPDFENNRQIFMNFFPSCLSLGKSIPSQVMIGGDNLIHDKERLNKLAGEIQKERRFCFDLSQVTEAIV